MKNILWGFDPSALDQEKVFLSSSPSFDETESPQNDLIKAILDKNIAAVESALHRGANPKLPVGKEKMSIYAFQHFDKDICNLLKKSGVAFGDASNLLETLAVKNDPNAAQWIFENFPPARHHGLVLEMMTYSCQHDAFDVAMFLIKNYPDTASKLTKSNSHHHSHLVSKLAAAAMVVGHSSLMEEVANPNGFLAKNCQEALRFLLSYERNYLLGSLGSKDKITLATLRSLRDFSEKYPSFLVLINQQIAAIQDKSFSDHGLKTFRFFKIDDGLSGLKKEYGSVSQSRKSQSLLDVLLCGACPVVLELADDPKAAQEILSLLGEKEIRMRFFYEADAAKALKLVEKLPEFEKWRDEQNNNFAHYIIAAGGNAHGQISKANLKEVYKKAPDLFFEPNAAEISPSSVVPADLLAQLQKQNMKREVKSSGILKNKAPTPKSIRRM